MPAWMRLPTRPSPPMATAQFFAITASVARTETVIAVPSAMAKTETMPLTHSPFRKAKERTTSAPVHGRKPTATIAAQAVLQPKFSPEISLGSGAWLWPQVEQTSPAS